MIQNTLLKTERTALIPKLHDGSWHATEEFTAPLWNSIFSSIKKKKLLDQMDPTIHSNF